VRWLPSWLDAVCRRRLGWATLASCALPWLGGETIKQNYQAGLVDDPVRSQMLIDFIVIGTVVFALTMVLTYAIGCWITAVMRGPQRSRDPLPLPGDVDDRAR
jgi:hypothetical protein